MRTPIDIAAATGGRFAPRTTEHGPPRGFEVEEDVLTVLRGSDRQAIDCATGLGPTAVCRSDGTVLGYGAMDANDLSDVADAADAVLGTTAGRPLERLAAHDLRFVLPLDAMPGDIRDALLRESVDPAFVEDAALTDDLIEEIMSESDHDHAHGPGETCATCGDPDPAGAMQRVREKVEANIRSAGHAVMMIMPGPDAPAFAYTVGLGDAGWPDMVLSGIHGDQSRMILNEAVSWLRHREIRPADGMLIEGAVSVPLRLRALDGVSGHAHARLAGERHVRLGLDFDDFHVLQLLWPDRSGRFPDQPGYDGTGLPPQTLL